jgi:hypothetical protein
MAEARYRDEEGLYGDLELVDLGRITYYPVVASYSATFQNEKFTTQLNAGVTYNRRPLSDDSVAFDNKRFDASPVFAHLNADLSHSQQLPEGSLWQGSGASRRRAAGIKRAVERRWSRYRARLSRIRRFSATTALSAISSSARLTLLRHLCNVAIDGNFFSA